MYILSTVCFRLVCSVNVLYMELSYTGSWTGRLEHQSMSQFRLATRKVTRMAHDLYGYVLFFMTVVGLFCECALYGTKLHWFIGPSTRASEHVTVQISLPIRLPGWQVFIIV